MLPNESLIPPEHRERYREWLERYPIYDENGIDLTLIRKNLALSPTERIRQAAAHARYVRRMMEIGRRSRESRA